MKINMQKIMEERDGTLRKIIKKMDQDRQYFNEQRVLMEPRFKEEFKKGKVDQQDSNRHAGAMEKQADDHAVAMAKLDLKKRKSKECHNNAIIAVSRALTGALGLGLALTGLGPGF